MRCSRAPTSCSRATPGRSTRSRPRSLRATASSASGPGPPTPTPPPLYPLYLSLFSLVGLKSWAAHRVASCLLGAATVGAVGILGRRVGGERVGLVAAGIAAVYPLLWVNDATVLSESLYGLLIALALI